MCINCTAGFFITKFTLQTTAMNKNVEIAAEFLTEQNEKFILITETDMHIPTNKALILKLFRNMLKQFKYFPSLFEDMKGIMVEELFHKN